MPKLLMFAPCEKLIIDQFNNPTLVSILQQWVPEQRDIPENTFAPQRWDIFTLWYRLAEDEGKEFVQYCDLLTPSGQKAVATVLDFTMETLVHRNVISVVGLPVNPGRYELVLYVSQKGAEKDKEQVGMFPLLVQSGDVP